LLLRISETLKPPPERTPDQWADQLRTLPQTKSEPGRWISASRPQTIAPQRAAVDPRFRTVVFITSTQVGKTAAALNVIGQKIDDDPGPILYLGPTRNNVNSVIEPELTAMLRSVEHLWRATYKGKDANKLAKQVKGVPVRLGWTGSATEVASMSAALVILDEADRMTDIVGEGDPVVLARARLSDYPDGTLYLDATPTLGTADTVEDDANGLLFWHSESDNVQSRAWREFAEGTQHHYAVPCQHCEQWFVPRFALLQIPAREDGVTIKQRADGAALACPHCGGLHGDDQRLKLLHAGCYVAPGQSIEQAQRDMFEGCPQSDTASFWASGLLAPKVSFAERATAWLKACATREPGTIQSVMNTSFGELYNFAGEAPDWQEVRDCDADYDPQQQLPDVQKVFVAADVGESYIRYVVRGWGYKYQSWGLEEGYIYADTSTADIDDRCWQELAEMRERTWCARPPEKLMLDTGYNTETCQQFHLRHKSWCMAMVGRDNPSALYGGKHQEKNQHGRTIKTGVFLWTIDHSHYKSKVHDAIGRSDDQNDAPRLWHICSAFSDTYCKEVVGESRIVLPSGRMKWHRTRANHALDCEYMQYALADILGVRHLRDIEIAPAPANKAAPKRRKSSYL